MHGPLRAAYVHRRYIVIDEETCVGCALCVKICPLKFVLKMDEESNKAVLQNPYYCAGCLKCVQRCPSKAISVATLADLGNA